MVTSRPIHLTVERPGEDVISLPSGVFTASSRCWSRSVTAMPLPSYPPEAFSGHSPCPGFLTEAGRQNANFFKMREHSRHTSLEMVAEYVRDHERFREHAGRGFYEPTLLPCPSL